jgi:hypothetical protein
MPNEEHMCLVTYQEKLPPRYYNAVMSTLNSPEGQAAKDFATALEGAKLEDDRNLAKVLYTEGHLKKVPANQVFATPYGYQSSNKIKLNELNDYMKKIEQGGDALKKLEDFDENKGYHGKKKTETAEIPIAPTPTPVNPVLKSVPESILAPSPISTDSKSASNELRTQGDNLRAVALQLLKQSKILTEKAETLFPTQPKRKRGRPVGTLTGTKTVVKSKTK